MSDQAIGRSLCGACEQGRLPVGAGLVDEDHMRAMEYVGIIAKTLSRLADFLRHARV